MASYELWQIQYVNMQTLYQPQVRFRCIQKLAIYVVATLLKTCVKVV
jgi:hypothetical protein